MSTIINFGRTPLPNTQFEGDIDDFIDLIVAHMTGTLENGAIMGQVGGSEPLSDTGFWFNEVFYKWNTIAGRYLPIPLVAGRVYNSTLFTTFLQSSATANRTLTLPDKNGTLATVADVRGNNPTQTLVGNGAIFLDALQQTRFYSVLIANISIGLSNQQDGDVIEIFIEQTSGNSFTVTWTGLIHWMGATPTMSSAAAGHRTVDHYMLYRVGGIMFGEYFQGADILVAGGDSVAPTVASASRILDLVTINYNEVLRAGSFTTTDFVVKYNGNAQTVQTASANGNMVTLNILNASAPADTVTVAYAGTGVKDLAGNSAPAYGAINVPFGSAAGNAFYGGQNTPTGPLP